MVGRERQKPGWVRGGLGQERTGSGMERQERLPEGQENEWK